MKLHSWNRFRTSALKVKPDVLGLAHAFTFESASVEIRLPTIDKVNRGPSFDELARVGARWAADHSPLEFEILKADVLVDLGGTIELPSQVSERPANAYDVVPEEEKRVLKQMIARHRGIAERAFEYWLAVMRWVIDDYRLGREERFDYRDGLGGTRLQEDHSGRTIWIEEPVITAPGYHRVTREEWERAQIELRGTRRPPLHIVLRQDAEEFLAYGDFRRCIIDLCVACETYMRTAVLISLPVEVRSSVRQLIEKADINRYSASLFPDVLAPAERERYQAFRLDVSDLFSARNKILHGGDSPGATSESCRRWLTTARSLFSLLPAHGA